MHRAERYTQRLGLVRGKLCCTVTAHWKGERFDVFRKFEDGRSESRNLYLLPLSGYLVEFPGTEERALYGTGTHKVRAEKWSACLHERNFPVRAYPLALSAEEAQTACSRHPGFEYVLQKCALSARMVVDILPVWKEHKDVELLLAAGWQRLALNKSLHRLTPAKKRAVCRFAAKCDLGGTPKDDVSLRDLEDMLKRRVPPEKAGFYVRLKRRFSARKGIVVDAALMGYIDRLVEVEERELQCARFFVEAQVTGLYLDYIALAARAGHDTSEAYWRFPKDLRAAHDRVFLEAERVREMERLAQEEKSKREQEAKIGRYAEALSRLALPRAVFCGYEVYVSFDAGEWMEQASALHQCIVTADYMQNVIDKKSVIVFLRRDGKPFATAEILPGKKIGQFYTDENSEDYTPPADAKAALGMWLEKAHGGILGKKAAA